MTAGMNFIAFSFTRLEKDIRFNYFWTRSSKLISVSDFFNFYRNRKVELVSMFSVDSQAAKTYLCSLIQTN
jgi:hypothetical protein